MKNIELTAPDRANELAKEALVEVNRLGAMFADVFGDPTACQMLAISHSIRKYHVERMGAAHAQNMAEFDEIRTLLSEARAILTNETP